MDQTPKVKHEIPGEGTRALSFIYIYTAVLKWYTHIIDYIFFLFVMEEIVNRLP